MSHVYTSNITHENESYHTYEWLISHIRMRTAIKGGEDAYYALSCRSLFATEPLIIGPLCRKRPMSLRKMTYDDEASYRSSPPCTCQHIDRTFHTYVTRMDESCQRYGWVMSHIWMRHIKHMQVVQAASDDYQCIIRAFHAHVTHMNESCRKCEWVISHT